MRKWWAVAAIVCLLLASVAGCVGNKEPGAGTAPAELKGAITVVGSTALQPLIEEAAKRFMAKNPGVQITVQGGGSGTGLSQVSQGACDIGASDIFAEEKSGIDASALKDHKICVQAFALVVNPDVKGVDNLTKKQIQDIFTGKITNWKEVGGPDLKIAVINRPQGSGTRATFIKRVMDGKEPIKGVAESDSSGTIHKMVSETPGAISYLGVGYLDNKVKALKIDGAAPTEEDISEGKYPFWSYGHLYTKGEPKPVVKAFIDYILSNEFQQGPVKEMHYFPITSMKVEYKP
ncbi:phosphate ABC transporter substrate-binding protein [Ammonifex degensii]|nr:phosphate ABC transporter substrate-binding protein [Ammonifex degensii]